MHRGTGVSEGQRRAGVGWEQRAEEFWRRWWRWEESRLGVRRLCPSATRLSRARRYGCTAGSGAFCSPRLGLRRPAGDHLLLYSVVNCTAYSWPEARGATGEELRCTGVCSYPGLAGVSGLPRLGWSEPFAQAWLELATYLVRPRRVLHKADWSSSDTEALAIFIHGLVHPVGLWSCGSRV